MGNNPVNDNPEISAFNKGEGITRRFPIDKNVVNKIELINSTTELFCQLVLRLYSQNSQKL